MYNYMTNRWQQGNQMPMPQPMMQQQQQMIQQQFPQMPQQQMLGLKGRLVSSLDEVKAMPVDMDGSETYFPHPASNSIFTKSIDMNGNQVIRKYVLATDNNKEEQDVLGALDKRVKRLEDILNELNGGSNDE